MVIRTIPANPVKSGQAVLTPDLFLALDRRARRLAKRPIRIRTARDMVDPTGRQLWGRMSRIPDLICTDLRKLTDRSPRDLAFREMGLIDLAAAIPLVNFRAARRPEIDWCQVPDMRVIEFVAMHEIGHACDNYDLLAPLRNRDGWTRDHDQALCIINEVLADRFAWAALFPHKPIPIASQRTVTAEQVDEWTVLLEGHGLRRQAVSKRVNLPASPTQFVPLDHVRKRVPWCTSSAPSSNASEYIDALAKARRDYRNGQKRAWRKQAAEMV